MTERPMIFSAPMVRAILEGRKSMTRRLLKPQPHFHNVWQCEDTLDWWQSGHGEAGDDPIHIRIQPGDTLWVREAWRASKGYDAYPPREMSHWPVHYEADGAPDPDDDMGMNGRLRASMHMPRWASRLTLPVSEVRVERLQDITDADAIAEGITCENVIVGMACYGGPPVEVTADRYFFDGCDEEGFKDAVSAYAALWDSINGVGAWAKNPWVTATTFAVERRNIDAEG